MSRRPPMPPDGNIRRAHQRMAPGGRLWSESPVRGPAVRVVAAGDDPYIIRPDVCVTSPVADGAPTYTGGAGSDILRDQSDATFATVDATYPGSVQTFPLCTFESLTVPGSGPIAGTTLNIRARTVDTVPGGYITLTVVIGIGMTAPGWETTGAGPYSVNDSFDASFGSARLSSSWTTFSLAIPAADWWDEVQPTVAQIAAGDIDGTFWCDWYDTDPHGPGVKTVDVADVWLELTP